VIDAPATQVVVYPVMAPPPFEAGAVNAILALALPATAAPIVGAPGTVTVVVPPDEPVPDDVLPSLPQPASPAMTAIPAIATAQLRLFAIAYLHLVYRWLWLSDHCGGNVETSKRAQGCYFLLSIFANRPLLFCPKYRRSVALGALLKDRMFGLRRCATPW
jgi:hypothetical protein